jgi:hypothetical protein
VHGPQCWRLDLGGYDVSPVDRFNKSVLYRSVQDLTGALQTHQLQL